MGCFTVLFSHAGTILAAACADKDAFPVVGKLPLTCVKHLRILSGVCKFKTVKQILHFTNNLLFIHLLFSVYEIPSGKVLAAFSGHLKIVYDLCWSRDDHRLLSASSDGTVRYVPVYPIKKGFLVEDKI